MRIKKALKSKLDASTIYTCLDFQGSGKILKPEVITSQSNAASLILLRHISDSFSPDPDSSTLLTSCQINWESELLGKNTQRQ